MVQIAMIVAKYNKCASRTLKIKLKNKIYRNNKKYI